MSSNRSWLETPLEDVCESIIDCVNKTAPSVDYTTPYKMIRTTNVRDGWVSLDNVKHVEEETYRKWVRRQKPEKGDVILTREAPLGEVGMLRSDEKVFLGQRLVSYRADPGKLDNRFLLYAFQGHFLQAQIKALGSGSTVEHMRVPDAKKLKILLPALSTQREVGAILSAYDDLIENNTRRIEILEEMARRLYEEWFVHFRFPGHEEVSFKESELGEIPEGWEVQELGDVSQINPEAIKPKSAPDEIHYIDIASVSPGQIDKAETMQFAKAPGRARRIVRSGDVLWSCVRPNRRSCAMIVEPRENTVASTGFAVLRTGSISKHYLYQYVRADQFVSYLVNRATGAAYPAVKAADFKEAKIIVPQRDILSDFDKAVAPMRSLIHRLDRKNANLRAQRDLLLPKLVSGEIDVSDISMPDDKEVEAA